MATNYYAVPNVDIRTILGPNIQYTDIRRHSAQLEALCMFSVSVCVVCKDTKYICTTYLVNSKREREGKEKYPKVKSMKVKEQYQWSGSMTFCADPDPDLDPRIGFGSGSRRPKNIRIRRIRIRIRIRIRNTDQNVAYLVSQFIFLPPTYLFRYSFRLYNLF